MPVSRKPLVGVAKRHRRYGSRRNTRGIFGNDVFRVISTSPSVNPQPQHQTESTPHPSNEQPDISEMDISLSMNHENDAYFDTGNNGGGGASEEANGNNTQWEEIKDSVLYHDASWDEGLAVVVGGEGILEEGDTGEEDETSQHTKTGSGVLNIREVTTALEDVVLRKLISGKTIEAISWFIGNKGATYLMYKRLYAAFNFYISMLDGHDKYPSYGTMLKRSSQLYNSHAFIRRFEFTAEVNTSRSGVPQRMVQEMRAGNVPTVACSVILPSDWARKDLLQYDFLHRTIFHPSRLPNCLYVDHAPVVNAVNREAMNHSLFELFLNYRLYTYGRSISMGKSIRLRLTGSSMDMREWFNEDSDVRVEFGIGGCYSELFGRAGKTWFAEENDTERDIQRCDAVTELLRSDGSRWRDALLVHRFSPKPGVRSSHVALRLPDGTVHLMGWSQLMLANPHTNDGAASTTDGYPSVGRLADGRRYAIMRCLLYTDDFRPFSFKVGSCGGCYLLPLSIPSWHRFGIESIRILSLTPPGVSTNESISAITDDIVRCSSEGVGVDMPDGSRLTLFLDLVGYIGDYPAMTHLLDVTGVAGKAPCNFCTFVRASVGGQDEDDGSRIEGSSYAYTSAIHSGNLAFRRTMSRMELARRFAKPDELKTLGLRQISDDERDSLPLHCLAMKLAKVRERVPMTSMGEPVVSCYIDPYLSCFVAPDHLFFGVGEDVAKTMLRMLSPSQRKHVDNLTVQALSSAGFAVEGSFLSATSLQIHQMAFHSFFTFMLAYPWACRVSTGARTSKREMLDAHFKAAPLPAAALHLLFSFQELYVSTMYIPVEEVDGKRAVDEMDGPAWHSYLKKLQGMATTYVHKVDQLCLRSPVARRELDKPNMHRLVEFYFHSLPRLGHAAVFQELVLEGGHQPLKRGIARSNHQGAHRQAMARFLADDWKRRLGDVASTISDLKNLTHADCRLLVGAAFGRNDAFDSGQISVEDVRRCFPAFVLKDFQTLSGTAGGLDRVRWVWIGREVRSFAGCDRMVLNFLRVMLTDANNRDQFQCYSRALRVPVGREYEDDNTPIRSARQHNERNSVGVGSFIQFLLKDEPHPSALDGVMLLRPDKNEGARSFWVIQSLFGVQNRAKLFAHVKRMRRANDGACFESIYEPDTAHAPHFVVPLDAGARKVLALHNCTQGSGDNQCPYNPETGILVHSMPECRSQFTLLGTREGFPPRQR